MLEGSLDQSLSEQRSVIAEQVSRELGHAIGENDPVLAAAFANRAVLEGTIDAISEGIGEHLERLLERYELRWTAREREVEDQLESHRELVAGRKQETEELLERVEKALVEREGAFGSHVADALGDATKKASEGVSYASLAAQGRVHRLGRRMVTLVLVVGAAQFLVQWLLLQWVGG